MASPSVISRTESAGTTDSTTFTVLRAAGVAGQLTVIVIAVDGTPTLTWPGGYTEFASDARGTDCSVKAAYHWEDGTEGTSISVTSSASEKFAAVAYSIQDAANPATQVPQAATLPAAATTTPDPPSVTASGGTNDYLFLTGVSQTGEEADDDTWASAAPTNYTNLLQKTSGIGGAATTNVSLCTAERRLSSVSSDNPGTFTVAQSLQYVAISIVVYPGPRSVTADAALALSPSLPNATLRTNVTAGVLTATPSLPNATLQTNLAGAVLTASPTLPNGSISVSGQAVTADAALALGPTMPNGSLQHRVLGAVLSAAPSLPNATLQSNVTGLFWGSTISLPDGFVNSSVIADVLAVTPSLPNGSLTTPQVVTADAPVSFAPAFPNGSLTQDIFGQFWGSTIALPDGVVNSSIAADVLTVTPSLPNGSISVPTLITADAPVSFAPALPNGSLTHNVLGQFWGSTIALPDGQINQSITATGTADFSLALPNGVVAPAQTLTADVLVITPTTPNGSLTHRVLADVLSITPSTPQAVMQLGLAGTPVSFTPSFPDANFTRGLLADVYVLTPTFPIADITGGIFIGPATNVQRWKASRIQAQKRRGLR